MPRTLLILLGLTTLIGCLPTAPGPSRLENLQLLPTSGKAQTLPDYRSLKIATFAPRTAVAGDLVMVEIALTNGGQRRIELFFNMGCTLLLEVFGPMNQEVGQRYGCSAFPGYLELEPGETIRSRVAWETLGYAEGGRVPLPAGRYRLVGYVPEHRDIIANQHAIVRLLPARNESQVATAP